MNSLIKPMIVGSFCLIAASVVPGVAWYCGAMGLIALSVTYAAGLKLFGAEDKDWTALQEQLKANSEISVSLIASKAKKLEELEAKVSKALADLRAEHRQGPLS